jgi:hypothetical protein
VTAALGSARDSGEPDRQEDSRAIVAGTYAPWYLVHRHPAWAPMAKTRCKGPGLRRTAPPELMVTDAGYVLVSGKEDGETTP